MMRYLSLRAGVIVFAFGMLVLFTCAVASAQTVTPAAVSSSTTVDFTGLVNTVVQFLFGGLAILAAWVLNILRTKLGLDSTSTVAQTLNTAMTNAIGWGQSEVATMVAKGNLSQVDVKSAIVAHAINYTLQFAPDAAKYFGYSTAQLEKLIVARLQQITPDFSYTVVDPATTTTATVPPVPPASATPAA